MTVKVTIRGADKVKTSISRKQRAIVDETKIGVNESGMLLKEEVQASINGIRAEPRSVKTGAFLESVEVTNTSTPNSSSSLISSDVEYAKFLEFGTSKIDERRHFRNSLARLRPVIKEVIKQKVITAIKT